MEDRTWLSNSVKCYVSNFRLPKEEGGRSKLVGMVLSKVMFLIYDFRRRKDESGWNGFFKSYVSDF